MTIAVDLGRKATKQKTKTLVLVVRIWFHIVCRLIQNIYRPAKIELKMAWTEPSVTNYKTRINNDFLTSHQHSMQSLQENDKYPILYPSLVLVQPRKTRPC